MFFKKVSELTHKEVVTGLKKLGFKKQSSKSTAHEQWKTADSFPSKKVTVDKHLSPFNKMGSPYDGKTSGGSGKGVLSIV